MPYAPGIQDISGQLIAQGMSQAGAARARAIESLGESIAGGIKQYQQNQMFTQQALGKFGMGLQDPLFKKYVDSVVNEEPDAPRVPEPVKKALKNAAAGKVDIYDAALLGTATEGYQQERMRQAQRQEMEAQNLLRVAQTIGALNKGAPTGQIMTFEEYQKLPKNIDASAKPVPGRPDLVQVTGYSLRADQPPLQPMNIGAEGGTIYDPVTGETRIIPRQPTVGSGEMLVLPPQPQGPLARFATGQQPAAGGIAPQARGVGPSAVPSGLPQFLPSGSMAPEGVRSAQQVPAAALAAVTPPTGPRIVAVPGGEAERKLRAEAEGKVAKAEREMRSSSNILNAIDVIERNKDVTSFGVGTVGMYPAARQAINQAANNVAIALGTIRANIGFQEYRDLKESGSSLGNMAVKEMENLQSLQGVLDQGLSKPEFDRAINRFKENAKLRMERIQILKNAYDAGETSLKGEAKKRYDALGSDLIAVEKRYLQPQQTPKAGLQRPSAPSGGNVMRLNVQRGEAAGTSTLAPAAPDLSAFEGRVLVNPQGKRVRIVNGKEVPLQ